MKKNNVSAVLTHKLAHFAASALCAVLFVCANTNSCCMVYQPETPAGLDRFQRLQ